MKNGNDYADYEKQSGLCQIIAIRRLCVIIVTALVVRLSYQWPLVIKFNSNRSLMHHPCFFSACVKKPTTKEYVKTRFKVVACIQILLLTAE
jgi:hypothetical protein